MDDAKTKIRTPHFADHQPRMAVMWRGDWRAPDRPTHYEARLLPVVEALRAEGFDVETIIYFDEETEAVRDRLLRCDGALVWINPIADGRDRTIVDAILRDVAAKGVWVSTHPDVIARMGTKDVLYWTRHLSWGSNTDLYDSSEAFEARFIANLAKGPRVLKPHRGNDGRGVLKIERVGSDGLVQVQHASDDRVETLRYAELANLLGPAFANGGRVIDQAFNPNARAGMVRCYMSQGRVVGFAEQRPRIEASDTPTPPFAMASAKSMHGPDAQAFRALAQRMEHEWVPGLQSLLGLAREDLPALWDADFLIRPTPDPSGNLHVLCEINVSCVSPFPDGAPAILAATAKNCVVARMAERRR